MMVPKFIISTYFIAKSSRCLGFGDKYASIYLRDFIIIKTFAMLILKW